MVWDVPVKDNKIGLPDRYWYFPSYLCGNFGPTFVNGIVDESKPIKCHDKAIENTIWGEYEWDINGVNLRGNASDLQRTKGVIEDGQFIIGKNS